MRMSREEKDNSYQRIVAGASRRLRERGFAGTSVADAMQDAGLTHGGFYRHFETKDGLLGAALEAAFDEILSLFDETGEPGRADAFQAFYLSKKHVDDAGPGCPAAALASEAARGSDALKRTFGAGIRRMVDALSEGADGRPAAARRLAMLVGGVALARASDPATAKLILAACRET